MATTLKITCPDAVVTPGRPKLYPDQIMSPGSLLLHEFAHPAGFDGSFATPPADLLQIPNIAWQTCASIIGSGNRTSLMSTFNVGTTSSIRSKQEWTTLKCLHVIISQVENAAAVPDIRLTMTTLLRDYIFANFTHHYYYSMWDATTRKALTTNTIRFQIGSSSAATNNRLMLFREAANSGVPAGGRVATLDGGSPSVSVLGPALRNSQSTSFGGTAPGAASSLTTRVMNFGMYTGLTGAALNQQASWMGKRVYIEDLTVSGRSYAEVDALDLAMWTAAHAPGGRFYGETAGVTYTNPSTIP